MNKKNIFFTILVADVLSLTFYFTFWNDISLESMSLFISNKNNNQYDSLAKQFLDALKTAPSGYDKYRKDSVIFYGPQWQMHTIFDRLFNNNNKNNLDETNRTLRIAIIGGSITVENGQLPVCFKFRGGYS